MATIKLKIPAASPGSVPAATPSRAPVRGAGSGVRVRPTLAQAQDQRVEREAQYQEQLRQRFGDRPPPEEFKRRGADDRVAPAARPDFRGSRNAAPPPHREARDNRGTGFNRDSRDSRDSHDNRDNRNAPTNRDPRDNRVAPVNRDGRDNRDSRDTRVNHDNRDPRDIRQRPAPANTPFDPRQEKDAAPRRHVAPGPSRDHWQPAPSQPAQRPPVRALRQPFDRGNDDDDDYFEHVVHPPGSMRLSKRMSELGIASRREADEWIAKGWVRVDDQIVSALGSRVMPGQRVTIDAKAKYLQAQKVTVLINKPVGYVSGQAEDGYEPAVVLVTPAYQWDEDHSGTRFLREHTKNLVPAGRLDIDSVGLLVLTQDGRVAKQLIGEDSDIEKEYLVRVASAEPAADGGVMLSDSNLALLRHGLELDGEALLPATVEWINADQLRFVLKQGKKRQLRRMCEAVGLQVLGLKRVRIGKVMLGDLPTGQWRYLRMDEGFI